jgi:hypothetical protein
MSRIGFGFGLDGSSQFAIKKWVGLGTGQVNLHMFFQIVDRFRLDLRSFDLGSGRVGSGWVRIGSGQVDFLKKSDPNRSDEFFRSGRILPPLMLLFKFINLAKKINQIDAWLGIKITAAKIKENGSVKRVVF